MTFDQFFEYTKGIVHREGRTFRHPDDDWRMHVAVDFVMEPVHSFTVPLFMMANYDARTLLGMALAHAAALTKPTKMALTQSAWLVDYKNTPDAPKPGDADFVAPSQSPHRFEAVFVVCLDQEIERAALARIHRRKRRPPVLGPWEQMPRDVQSQGHLTEPLREALR
jgi:hypothetical protein